jgi:hypothetical protein
MKTRRPTPPALPIQQSNEAAGRPVKVCRYFKGEHMAKAKAGRVSMQDLMKLLTRKPAEMSHMTYGREPNRSKGVDLNRIPMA